MVVALRGSDEGVYLNRRNKRYLYVDDNSDLWKFKTYPHESCHGIAFPRYNIVVYCFPCNLYYRV